MEMKHTISLPGSNGAGAAANLTAQWGAVALRDAVGLAAGRHQACLPGGASVAAGALDAVRPLGIIESADNAAGSLVTIVSDGIALMRVGAAGLPAGTHEVSYDNLGLAIAPPAYEFLIAPGGALAAASWTVGHLVHDDFDAAAAYVAGQLVKVYVNPQRITHA